MKKNWLRIFSPCIIAVIFLLITIVWGFANKERTNGWSYLAVIIFVPYTIALLVADVLIKIFIKTKILYLWLAEIALIIISILLFKYYIG